MSFKNYHDKMNEKAKQLARRKDVFRFVRGEAPLKVLRSYLPIHLQYRGLLPIDVELFGQLNPDVRHRWEEIIKDRCQFAQYDEAQTLLAHIYHAHDGRLFEVTKALSETLQLVDVSPSIPACYLKPPFPVMYFGFEDRSMAIDFGYEQWPLDGIMMIETSMGDAIGEGRIKLTHNRRDLLRMMSNQGLIDLSRPEDVYGITVVMVGQSNKGLIQHPTFFFEYLYQVDSDTTIGDTNRLFREYMEHEYALHCQHDKIDIENYTSEQMELDISQQHMGLNWLTKLLLYTNAHPEDREMLNPHSDLIKQVRGTLSKTKAKQLQELADQVCNKIVIGGGLSQELKANLTKTDEDDKRHTSTHWRRGHIRRQPYGPGRQQIKLKMIPPVLVNKDLGMPVERSYQLK